MKIGTRTNKIAKHNFIYSLKNNFAIIFGILLFSCATVSYANFYCPQIITCKSINGGAPVCDIPSNMRVITYVTNEVWEDGQLNFGLATGYDENDLSPPPGNTRIATCNYYLHDQSLQENIGIAFLDQARIATDNEQNGAWTSFGGLSGETCGPLSHDPRACPFKYITNSINHV